ncbi:hypothetical protein L3i20_v225350 [Paenibacillus sp. L3-i20]|nr:hypothetical protein L3i20_v225350 [Paenibacillus sp. L3-i20]
MRMKRTIIYVVIFCLLATMTPPPPPAKAQAASAAAFTDIKGHWAQKTIRKWQENGDIEGYEDGSFKPNQSISRAEFTALVNRKMNLNVPVFTAGFRDVESQDWFYRDVANAKAAGYIQGYNEMFFPKKTMSRQEAAVVVHNWMEKWKPKRGESEVNVAFQDVTLFAEWSSTAITRASQYKLIDGYTDGLFKPKKPITRAETLVIIDRLSSLYDKDEAFNTTADNVQYEEVDFAATDHPLVHITSPTYANVYALRENVVTLSGSTNATTSDRLSYATDDGRNGELTTKDGQWELASLQLLQDETTVTITLKDDEGRSISDKITIRKDTLAPSLLLTNAPPAGTVYRKQDVIDLAGTASDNVQLDRIIYINHSEEEVVERTAEGLEKWYIAGLTLVPGVNNITIKAIDYAGNETSQSLQVAYNESAVLAGELEVSNQVVFVGESGKLLFHIPVEQYLDSQSEVALMEVAANGNVSPLAKLNDNGNLYSGDDIDGDGIYSTLLTIDTTEVGELRYRAELTHSGEKSTSKDIVVRVVKRSSDKERTAYIELINELQQQEEGKMSGDEIASWLKNQPDIASTGLSSSGGSIWYKTKQGLSGAVLIGESGTKGSPVSGGSKANFEDKQVASIASSQSTTQSTQYSAEDGQPQSSNEDYIASANILIVSPFAAKGLSSKAYDELAESFKDTRQFNVNHLKNEAATVESFKELSRYGVIVFDTHGERVGSGDEVVQAILTGEKVTAANLMKYEADMQTGLLVEVNGFYAITPKFLETYNDLLPGSLVFNASCLSLSDAGVTQSFLALGAKSYFGYSDYIKVVDDQAIVSAFFQAIIVDQATVGAAYEQIKQSNLAGQEMFQMIGSGDLTLKTQFLSTSFEEGKVARFDTKGDVRVVSKVGSILPAHGDYMALMSTGIGSVENKDSSMEQFVEIPAGVKSITFDYNIISEEPMEWVDSDYDDKFKVTIVDGSSEDVTLAEQSVNHSQWRAVPDLNLDGGDNTAYMTGWKRVSADVSDFAGEGSVRIQFQVLDEGDVEYDTVVLLDDVKISYLEAMDETDEDYDGLSDELESQGIRIGYNGKYVATIKLDPENWDTDRDGLSDGAELLNLNYYYQEDGGFYESIDHPTSKVTSAYSRDIHAELKDIIDVQANSIEEYKANIIKAEQYKVDLVVYSNKIAAFLSDIRPIDREAFLTYLAQIRTLKDALNQSIADYAGQILVTTDEEAKAWLIESNIGLMNSEFGEGEVANPLNANQKLGIENYRDLKKYTDAGTVSGGLDYEKLLNMSSKELQQMYSKLLQERPITPYESYEYVMNSSAFESLLGFMEAWWMYNGDKQEENKKFQIVTAIEALEIRNNPCSYLPDGCGLGTAKFKQFFDRYFFIEYQSPEGKTELYSVEADLGVRRVESIEHTVYALVEPTTKEVRYIGRTASPKEKQEALARNLKFVGLEWKEIYLGNDYSKAREAEREIWKDNHSSTNSPKVLIGVRLMTDKAANISVQLQSVRGDIGMMQQYDSEITKGLWDSLKNAVNKIAEGVTDGLAKTWDEVQADIKSKVRGVVITAYILKGIGMYAVETLIDFFSIDIQMFLDLIQAITSREITISELLEAVVDGIRAPFEYVFDEKNYKLILNAKATNEQAETYGKNLGAVLEMIVGVFFGGAATIGKLIKVLSKVSESLSKTLTKRFQRQLDEIDGPPKKDVPLFGNDGKFLSSLREKDYQSFVAKMKARGKKVVDRAAWFTILNHWLFDNWTNWGTLFNNKAKENDWYPFNDIRLSNGNTVSSYNDFSREIVIRRAVDMEAISTNDFTSLIYKQKLVHMYGPKSVVTSSSKDVIGKWKYDSTQPPSITNRILDGRLVIEIPSSNSNFANRKDYEEIATKNNITIKYKNDKESSGCNCFTAGTKVLTDDGEKPIEDIKVGDMVLSKNEETGEQAYKEVLNLFRNKRDVIYKLSVDDQLIETTFNHPFWVEGKGWVLAEDLAEGDILQKSNREHLTIDNIELVQLQEKVTVYNFEVEGFHTYYVTDLGIWVHNTNTKDCDIEGTDKANLKNIDDFIKGKKKFDEVVEDYAKIYKERIDSNKPWSWDDTIPGGDSLSSTHRRKIKEMAIAKGHIPDIKVTKVDGMKYGFAAFAVAGVVEETIQLPKKLWKSSDKEQFKWLDEQIGGTRSGMTWHHTEIPGKMELVPFGIHNITPHNGGRTAGMWADAPR